MPTIFNRASVRKRLTAERVIAIAAVVLSAAGLAQPQILALAGLDFSPKTVVAQRDIDTNPTGSTTAPSDKLAGVVHGLAGALKPLRSHD